MSNEAVEVRTQLAIVGIEEIKQQLKQVSGRFNETDKSQQVAQKGMGDWIQKAHALTGVLGTNLSDVAGRIRATGEEFIRAGSAAESGDQAVGALIASAQGRDADAAIETAAMLGDRLDEIAIKAGVSGDALGEAYQVVLERTGATENGLVRATEQIDAMAIVAGKLGKDVGAIAGEFAFMQEGTVKVKGQLFQLLQPTGIFGKDVKKAAEHWASLTEESRSQQLAYGLEQLASKMQKLPPTFAQTEASFANVMRIGREKIGEPLIKELNPALAEVVEMLREQEPVIEEFGTIIAKEVGQGVRDGGKMLKEALSWLREHKSEIADDLRAAAQAIRSAVGFVVDNRGIIATAFAAKAAAPVLQAGAGAVSGVASAGAAGILPGLAGAAGAAASLGLLAAAIAALGAIAYAEYQLIDGLKERWDDQTDSLRRLYEMAERGDVESVENAVVTMHDLKRAAGELTPELQRQYDVAIALAYATRERVAEEGRSGDILRTAIGRQINILRDVAVAAETQGISQAQQVSNSAAVLVSSYEIAIRSGNTAMATLAAQTIAGNEAVKMAFLKSATDIEGGFGQMADLLLAGGGQFAGFAAQLKGKGATPPPPKVVMNGGQTFKIQQDFRNQDPDRIAVVFKRDLGRAVERRTGGRFAGPFGY